MKQAKSKFTQIRLLLPEEWVPELNKLAASRFLTRLGLIRYYLRLQMDDDLAQLAEHYKLRAKQKEVHWHLSQELEDREW